MPKRTVTAGRTREAARHSLYLDTPPVSLIISRWVREHAEEAPERQAGENLRRLGEPTDLSRALAELERLENEGSALAAYSLGVARLNGKIVPRDRAAALRSFRLAARRKFPLAYLELARASLEDGGPQAARKRLDFLRHGALAGSVHCCLDFAGEVLAGRTGDVPEDREVLTRLLLAAARDGSWSALVLLLELYGRPYGAFLPGEALAAGIDLLREAAVAGWLPAMCRLGDCLLDGTIPGGSRRAAGEWFRRAWEKGCRQAGVRIAEMILNGEEGAPSEEREAKAVSLLEKACLQGSARAHAVLGRHLVASGKKDSFRTGLTLLRRAAQLGESAACADFLWQLALSGPDPRGRGRLADELAAEPLASTGAGRHRLGLLLLTNLLESPPAPEKGLELLRQAAEEGFGPACGSLSDIFYLGLYGQPPDASEARRWAGLGLLLGDPRSVITAYLLRRALPPDMPGSGEDECWALFQWAEEHGDRCARLERVAMTLTELGQGKEASGEQDEALDTLACEVVNILHESRREGDVGSLASLIILLMSAKDLPLLPRLAEHFPEHLEDGDREGMDQVSTPGQMALLCLRSLPAAGDRPSYERLSTFTYLQTCAEVARSRGLRKNRRR